MNNIYSLLGLVSEKHLLNVLDEVREDVRESTGSFKYDFVFELILLKLNEGTEIKDSKN